MFGTDYNYLTDLEADTISGTLIDYLDNSIANVSGSISDEIDTKSNSNHTHAGLESNSYVYLTCSGTTIESSGLINWHTTIVKDDNFLHTVGSGVITTLSGGLYNLAYHVNFVNNEVDALNPAFMIKINGTTVSATENYIYNPGSTHPYSSIDGEVMYEMSANDYFGVYTSTPQSQVCYDIGIGNTATNFAVSTNNVSQNLTISSNANRIVIACITFEDSSSGDYVSSATFNGSNMTLIDTMEVGTGTIQRVEMWLILESSLPVAGSYSCAVTLTSSVQGVGLGVLEIYDAKQQAPEAKVKTSILNANTISQNITTLTDKALIISVVGSGETATYTHGTGQTELWDFTLGSATSSQAATYEEKAVAGVESVSHTASGGANNRQAMITVAFAILCSIEGDDISLVADECSVYGELIKYS